MPDVSRFRLATGAAARFTREHGVYRALRLFVTGLATLGPRGLVHRAAADARQREDDARYRAWLAAHPVTQECLVQLHAQVAALPFQPAFSIVVPVFNTDADGLRQCLESVRSQVYPRWELCVCDDGSTDPATVATLDAFKGDARIRIVRSATNRGIVQASNAALTLATADFVGFLDHDDELAPDALAEIVRRLNADPQVDIVYTDEDKIDTEGTRRQPHFKPDWSPELLRSCMYVSHFTVMRRSLVQMLGGFRAGFDGAQDYDLMLRAAERTERIAHVAKVLYHWRMTVESAANSQLGKPWAMEAGRRALDDHLGRASIPAKARPAEAAGHYRARYTVAGAPLVSILIPAPAVEASDARLSRELRILASSTAYPNYEVVPVRGERLSKAGISAALNVAIQSASGEHVVILDGLARPSGSGWLEALLEFSQQPEIGAVGGIVLFADGTIDNAGFVLGLDGVARPAFRGEPHWTRGHLSNIIDIRNCSAVSAACLMTKRKTLQQAGGFNEQTGAGAYDVDYCLRVRRAGLRVVVTPYARVRRPVSGHNSPPEAVPPAGHKADEASQDPYYNPNFDQRAGTFRL